MAGRDMSAAERPVRVSSIDLPMNDDLIQRVQLITSEEEIERENGESQSASATDRKQEDRDLSRGWNRPEKGG